MSVDITEKVIELLEAIRARRVMFFGKSDDVQAYVNFHNGVQTGLVVAGIAIPTNKDFDDVFREMRMGSVAFRHPRYERERSR